MTSRKWTVDLGAKLSSAPVKEVTGPVDWFGGSSPATVSKRFPFVCPLFADLTFNIPNNTILNNNLFDVSSVRFISESPPPTRQGIPSDVTPKSKEGSEKYSRGRASRRSRCPWPTQERSCGRCCSHRAAGGYHGVREPAFGYNRFVARASLVRYFMHYCVGCWSFLVASLIGQTLTPY
ncbi:hypothetical protein BS17DRAFT_527049 [Gyrodon lividus]|nr:hypothetical protein BS17DRAFT_527049 [Gyrodon lividus]